MVFAPKAPSCLRLVVPSFTREAHRGHDRSATVKRAERMGARRVGTGGLVNRCDPGAAGARIGRGELGAAAQTQFLKDAGQMDLDGGFASPPA